MKRTRGIYTAATAIAALVIGFAIGISVEYPIVNKKDVSGTIGKVNNYRNVNLSDEDIQLRADLLSDKDRQKAYADFYSFHYGTAAELTTTLEVAIKASENLSDFKNVNSTIINNLKQYQKSIGQSRADLLLALNALQSADIIEPADFGAILNNANMAIAQMDYNDETIVNFIDEAGIYLSGKTGTEIALLSKAYNHLLILQATKAIVCNNKPKIKYLDGKELFASSEQPNLMSREDINMIIFTDQENLNLVNSGEQLNRILSNEILGSYPHRDDYNSIFAVSNAEQLNAAYTATEQLRTMSNAKLGSSTFLNIETLKLALKTSENMGAIYFNIESLGGFLNIEKLGAVYAQ